MLHRTEGVTCDDLTRHDDGAPVPDCKKVYGAWVRGRDRVVKEFPEAIDVKMSTVTFWQTKVYFNPDEQFPRMLNVGAMAETLWYADDIIYAFEETIEHEATHWIMYLINGTEHRTQAAIDLPRDVDQVMWQYLKEIACHNTSDDPFGDGFSMSKSGRAGCIRMYNGIEMPNRSPWQ